MAPTWADARTLRDLRRDALNRARQHRADYRREGFGLDHRLMLAALEDAREYRAAERVASQSQQRAA